MPGLAVVPALQALLYASMLMPRTLTMLPTAGLDSQTSLHSIPSLHSNQEGDFRLANEEQQKAISLQGALSRWDSEHRESGMCVKAALVLGDSQQQGLPL